MASGQILAQIAEQLVPSYTTQFDWGNMWLRPWPNGAAFEWTTLAALISQAEHRKWNYSFPILEQTKGASLFPLRNEVPYHHGAQAGHTGANRPQQSLALRFLQSLIPKVIFEKDGKYYSVFREGCPYHEIMMGLVYNERPDILFLAGRPTPDFPKLLQGDLEVAFSFDLDVGTTISGRLRVVNSTSLPCRTRFPREGMKIPIAGIVECSINKVPHVATNQLGIYEKIFTEAQGSTPLVLITGNDLSTLSWPHYKITLTNTDHHIIETDFRAGADLVLTCFGLI